MNSDKSTEDGQVDKKKYVRVQRPIASFTLSREVIDLLNDASKEMNIHKSQLVERALLDMLAPDFEGDEDE